MYMHDDTDDRHLQAVVLVGKGEIDPLHQAAIAFIPERTSASKDDDENDELTALDPLGDRVWSIVADLLKNKSEVTIQDLLEVSDIKESALRNRLNLLVKLKHLACVNGTGRRPTYYFLPQAQNNPELASTECVIKTLEKSLASKELEEKQLLAQLQIVSADKEAIQRTIKVLLAGGDSNV